MSGYYSYLDLEGAEDTSSGYVGSVSVAGESVAGTQLTRPMGEASVSSEGAVSAAGLGNILGSKRHPEVMSEEEKSLRHKILAKEREIKAMEVEIKGYEDKLNTIEANIIDYEKLYKDDPNNNKICNSLILEIEEKIEMYRKISETMDNVTQKENKLAKLNDKLERLLRGMLVIFKYLGIYLILSANFYFILIILGQEAAKSAKLGGESFKRGK